MFNKWKTMASYTVNGVTRQTEEYSQWNSMRQRCMQRIQEIYPTYLGCEFDPLWESYDEYYWWAMTQIGFNARDERGRRFNLDKDYLDGKLYSPDTCVFIPHTLNIFLISSQASRGEHPRGVYFHKESGKFVAKVSCAGLGKTVQRKTLGYFKTPELAHEVYVNAKVDLAKEHADVWRGKVDPRVIEVLENFRSRLV